MQDPRYFDLTWRVAKAGISWDDLDSYLSNTTLHPFRQHLTEMCSDDLKKIIGDHGDVEVYKYATGSFLKVHVGAVEHFCKYLNLEEITMYDAALQNLNGRTLQPPKTLGIPVATLREIYCAARRVGKNKKEIDRIEISARVIDQDQILSRAC